MNNDSPDFQPEQNEARLTALLLRELSPAEETEVWKAIANDRELARLHGRLARTIGFLNDAVGTPLREKEVRMSESRRQFLLQQFKTVTPPELIATSHRGIPWFVPMGIAASLIGLLIFQALGPALKTSKTRGITTLSSLSRPEKDAKDLGSTAKETLDHYGLIPESVNTEDAAKKADSSGNNLTQRGVRELRIDRETLRENLDAAASSEITPSQSPTSVNGVGGVVKGIVTLEGLGGGVGGGGGAGQAINQVAEPAKKEPARYYRQTPAPPADGTLSLSTQSSTSFALNFDHDKAAASTADSPQMAALLSDTRKLAEASQKLGLEPGTPEPSLASKPQVGFFESEGKPREEQLLSQLPGINETAKLGKQVVTGNYPAAEARDKKTVADEALSNRSKSSEKTELVDQLARVDRRVSANSILPAAVPQPEVETGQNAFSTFSLNVADVSFKLAAASLEKGVRPDPSTIRSEEFVNAFNYRDPEAAPGVPVAFAWDRAQYPFAHNRDLLRLSVRTAARGREAGRPLNIVLLLDNSGSMERADRVRIIHQALVTLAQLLQAQDRVSVVAFARTARLWVDALPGDKAGELADRVGNLTPDGGTNLEEALNLAYATASKHFSDAAANRVVLLTDGAANLGDVNPESLKQKVESWRQRGIALDCFGIGWDGFNDDLLEVLARNGDGRYGFVNTPEEASTEFAAKLAGALHVAASDVKAQVEFNPQRVTVWRQIGYAKHQLTKEQFRDNTVDAAELAAAESGNALYVIQVDPNGNGAIGTLRVRYREPDTGIYREHEWPIPYNGTALPLDRSAASLRLAGVASAFSEWLSSSPFAGEVTLDKLLNYMQGVPAAFDPDPRPKQLEWMIRQAKTLFGQ